MAATGTPTPNIGLRCPVGTDPASVDDINYNSGVIDTKLGAVGSTSVQAQIDALNSKSTTKNNLTASTGVTLEHGYYIKFGNIVIFNVYATFTENKGSYATFAEGLPYAQDPGARITFACNYDSVSTFCFLSYAGLYVGTDIGTAESGKKIRVSGAYVSNA